MEEKKYEEPYIDKEMCEEIIQKYSQETNSIVLVNGYEIIPAPDAKGFLGNYFYLKIDCKVHTESNEPNSSRKMKLELDDYFVFFLKSLPTSIPEGDERVKIFEKESILYESLFPKLQKYSSVPWCPKIYLCNRDLLVLEELNCHNYSILSMREFLKEGDMYPVLNTLASMHASSLLYEFKEKANINDLFSKNLEEITVHPDIPWFKTGIEALITIAKEHPRYQRDASQEFINDVLPDYLNSIHKMVNPSTKYRNVLCHRDIWAGNIFVSDDISLEKVILVDFQTCRYSPAAIDVIFTLFINLTKEERIQAQTASVQYYYQKLRAHLKKYIADDKTLNDVIFTQDELFESIEEFKLFGLVYRALAITILNVPKNIVTDDYKNVDRKGNLMAYMIVNQNFSELLNESIEDIIEEVKKVAIEEVEKVAIEKVEKVEMEEVEEMAIEEVVKVVVEEVQDVVME